MGGGGPTQYGRKAEEKRLTEGVHHLEQHAGSAADENRLVILLRKTAFLSHLYIKFAKTGSGQT
eukprot:COSAG06_NODE_13461_length_1255_cov_1.197232_1_plen_64_part_00